MSNQKMFQIIKKALKSCCYTLMLTQKRGFTRQISMLKMLIVKLLTVVIEPKCRMQTTHSQLGVFRIYQNGYFDLRC